MDSAPVSRLNGYAGRTRRRGLAVTGPRGHVGSRRRGPARRQALERNVSRETLRSSAAPPIARARGGSLRSPWSLSIHQVRHRVRRPIHRVAPRRTQSLEPDAAIARLMRGRSRSRAAGSSPRPTDPHALAEWHLLSPNHPGAPGAGRGRGSRRSASQIRKASPGRTTRYKTGPIVVHRQRSISAAGRARPVTRGGRRPGGWVPRRCCRFGRRRGQR